MPITKGNPVRTISQCSQCGYSFDGLVLLKDHIKKAHIPDRIAKFNQPVVDETPEEKPKEDKPAVPINTPSQPLPVVKPDPIVLEYKFKGMCPDCRHEPRTIILDIDDYSFAIAFCSNCDKKLVQQKVIPISYQGQKNEKAKL